MSITKHISTAILLLFTCLVMSQEKRIAKADKNFAQYAYIDARAIYLDVASKGYTSASLYEKLGDSYYFNAELEKSVKWYEALLKEYPSEVKNEYLFRYAQSLKSIKKYEAADKVMEKFNIQKSSDNRGKTFMKTRDYLNFIEIQSGKFELAKMAINSKYSDYGPSFHNDALVFASSRKGNTSKRIIHEWNEMPFLDLFTIPQEQEEVKPRKLKGRINTKFHESSATFNKTGDTVYFTRNNYTKRSLKSNEQGTTLLKLYRAVFNGKKWQDVIELPFNSDEYSVAHPSLSSDGKTLYFASNMPGSIGESDIFKVAIARDGSFGKPENLGDNINTEGRETFPFISASNQLFFASDGHTGLGGLDVFVSVQEEGELTNPYNVGRPINSSDDDFTFIIDEESKTGYFSSNRKGGMGSDDIYKFKQLSPLITGCKQYLSGTVTDKNTGKKLTNATVILMDGSNKELERTTTTTAGTYRFNIECNQDYVIRASEITYGFTEERLSSNEILEHEFNIPLKLGKDNLTNRTAIPGDDLSKILKLEIIYFDLNKSKIRPDAAIELQKIIAALQKYPSLKIDVRSHTDSRANSSYNKNLSERRARSTISYIIKKGGIDKKRITGRGYGESTLLNKCKDGVDCSEIEHQLNRRSEFIIIQ